LHVFFFHDSFDLLQNYVMETGVMLIEEYDSVMSGDNQRLRLGENRELVPLNKENYVARSTPSGSGFFMLWFYKHTTPMGSL
jgi:hypothetical protein